MFSKEAFHCPVKVKAVFFVVETVSFVIFHHVFNGNVFLLERIHNLIRMLFFYAGVICSLCNKQRNFNIVDMENRRYFFK